jgi:hypothetical protein
MVCVIVMQETNAPGVFGIAEQFVEPPRMGPLWDSPQQAVRYVEAEVNQYHDLGYNPEGDFWWGRAKDGHGIRLQIRP